jgi:hypothetical protein
MYVSNIRISTRFERQHLSNFFIGNLQLRNHVKTKILVHNRDSSLKISHSSIFILIIINKTINKYIFIIKINIIIITSYGYNLFSIIHYHY